MADLPSDGSRQDGDGSSARRRPVRPLDSEGEEEEEEEEETSGKEGESSDREDKDEEVSERLSSGKVSAPCAQRLKVDQIKVNSEKNGFLLGYTA